MPFPNALRKYGRNNFLWEIIEETKKDNNGEREIYWIDTLKPQYNATLGGDGGRLMYASNPTSTWTLSTGATTSTIDIKTIYAGTTAKTNVLSLLQDNAQSLALLLLHWWLKLLQ